MDDREPADRLETEKIKELLRDEPRKHPLFFGLALLFLLLSVPFYYPASREPVLYGGLPDWCWITLISDFLFAVVVAILILFYWKEDSKPEGEPDG